MSTKYLAHHGIIGQKWGVRRFQNQDGSLTSAGRKRYVSDYDSSDITKKKTKNNDFGKIGYVSRGKSYVNKVKAEVESMKDTKDSGLSKKDRRRLAKAEGLKSEANDIRQNAKVRATKNLLKLPDEHPHNQSVVEKNIRSRATAEILDARAKRLENKVNKKTNYGSSDLLKKDISRNTANDIASDADKLVKGTNTLRKAGKKSTDLSKYSDAELQKIVNRQQLEQRYNQLNPDKIDRGSEILRESIQTAGAAAGLYASYKIIKKL